MSEWKAAARNWLAEDPDPTTREELRALLARGDEDELADRFGARLEFGTAGLRGVLGAGPNRMNRAVVLRTTAGLCEYLLDQVPDASPRGVVVGYDGRRMSREFARDAAAVIAGAGIPVHLFKDVVPTPLVAYAVRDLGAAAGVMITASHNPPAYNGYKVYWGNGAQIIPPHDKGIASAIAAIGPLVSIAQLPENVARNRGRLRHVPDALAERYLDGVRALARHPDAPSDLRIVYTALHGVGNALATKALARFGTVHSVPEQAEPDGTFPTVSFPNPEEKGALDLALALARSERADLILANDPDADRLAVAVRRGEDYVQLTGNEVGALLGHWLLTENPPAGDKLVATTIVSSPLLGRIARTMNVRYAETLTGFKWIANRAIEVERATGAQFVFGFEEALGYSVGALVRDKDGISAAFCVAEIAAVLKSKGQNLLDRLEAIYRRYGLSLSAQRSVTAPGVEGMRAITATMDAFRVRPPERLGGRTIEAVKDYQPDPRKGSSTGLPPSNVIAFELAGGSRVTLRPSGTEPKIKYYFDHREELGPSESYEAGTRRAQRNLDELIEDFMQQTASRGGVV